jgi:putative PIN family toxin of toxin-antitoxin system
VIRVVLDPGVVIAGLISTNGAPAELLRQWVRGHFQLVVSEALVEEFVAVAARPKFRQWFDVDDAEDVARLMWDAGDVVPDVLTDELPPPDVGDAYLVHLVASSGALTVVTGDRALLGHRGARFTATSPRDFLEVLMLVEGDRE